MALSLGASTGSAAATAPCSSFTDSSAEGDGEEEVEVEGEVMMSEEELREGWMEAAEEEMDSSSSGAVASESLEWWRLAVACKCVVVTVIE